MLHRSLHSEMAMDDPEMAMGDSTKYQTAFEATRELQQNPESEEKARKQANELFESLAQHNTEQNWFNKDIFLS